MVIKLTTPWQHSFLKLQIPFGSSAKFHVDDLARECDYWIIWGGLPPDRTAEWAQCPAQNVLFMTDEVHDQKRFDKNFLRQFSAILTNRQDIEHSNVIKIHEFNHWHLNKSLADLAHQQSILKSRSISVVCSDLTDLPGHKARYALVNRLIGHFKDRLDVYGRGFNAISDKWDALAPYKYSIAIENNCHPGYFTEKISECYLAHTFPIYYGAPNICDYFDKRSMLLIDIRDYMSCITNIEKLLDEDPYYKVEDLIIKQKIRYLKRYHLFPALLNLLLSEFPDGNRLRKEKVLIKSQATFSKYYHARKIARGIKALLQ